MRYVLIVLVGFSGLANAQGQVPSEQPRAAPERPAAEPSELMAHLQRDLTKLTESAADDDPAVVALERLLSRLEEVLAENTDAASTIP